MPLSEKKVALFRPYSGEEGVNQMDSTYEQIKDKLLRFIEQDSSSEQQFNEMALSLFAYQYENNQPFRKYCRKRKASPSSIKHYTEIPPVPITAFKQTELSCCPPEETAAVFMTSGTTNPAERGKNYHRDLDVWKQSMRRHFKPYILPDRETINMAILFPTKEELPNSSLANYLDLAKLEFGTVDSSYMFKGGDFDRASFLDWLRRAEQKQDPVLLIGATFSFIHWLDYCLQNGLEFRLPEGSRMMDTGGAKGRSREMDPADLKGQLANLFHVPDYACVNMYGMTELSSQFYQSLWRDAYLKQEIKDIKVTPHWVKTIVIHPETMKELPYGEKGIIVHYDLANLNSSLAIMTEDAGVAEPGGFRLLGRASGAEAKGCSLAVEAFLLAAHDQSKEETRS
jgi:hypothetical protein